MVSDGQSRHFRMGFSPFPWDYGVDIREQSLKFVATQGGDLILHHVDFYVPWPEAIANEPIADALNKTWADAPDQAFNTTRREDYLPEGSKVYVALTPMNQGRNNIAPSGTGPAPEGFLEKGYGDPAVQRAYLNYCRRAIEHFQPDYLAIAIEINELMHNNPEAWEAYLQLHKFVYGELKKDHPSLPIFATMTAHGLLQPDRKNADEEMAKIKDFLRYNDFFGVSFYPSLTSAAMMEDPSPAFAWIREMAGDKPIAICETGIPAEATEVKMWPMPPSTPEMQRGFYEKLLAAAQKDHYEFVAVFLHRDYDRMWEKLKETRPDWQRCWQDTGLFDEDGVARPAWTVWQQYLAMPYSR